VDTPCSVHRGLYGPSRSPVKHLLVEIRRNLRHLPTKRPPRRSQTRKRKCTEPVAPSSGFPTGHRRSDNHSESHQPRTLRTRCIADSRGAREPRQGAREATSRKLRSFLFTQGQTAVCALCSSSSRGKKKAGHEGPTARAVGSPEAPKSGGCRLCRRWSGKSSPSRERFRPPSRRTFRFRVVLLGGLRPTGAPCSAQAAMYGIGPVRSRGYEAETSRYLRAY
jgi:hypothetical protein